jgi:hypothetical protein
MGSRKYYQHNANEDPQKMSDHQGPPNIGKRVGEFLILGIYLVIDVVELWHITHLGTLAAAFVGVIALLLLDGGFSRRQIAAIGGFTVVACVALYFFAPPELREETENHGWLEPARDPLPNDNACTLGGEVQKAFPGGTLFALGKAGMWFPKKSGGKRPLLTVGSCTLMSAEFENDRLLFDADIYDQNQELVARIARNEFHLVQGKIAYPSRPDRSTLKIYGKSGELLLFVRFRNQEAIDVSGTFICSDGKKAKVEADRQLTMTGPKGTQTWSGPCLVKTGGFVVSDWGFGIGPTPCWACEGPACPYLCARERAKEKGGVGASSPAQ